MNHHQYPRRFTVSIENAIPTLQATNDYWNCAVTFTHNITIVLFVLVTTNWKIDSGSEGIKGTEGSILNPSVPFIAAGYGDVLHQQKGICRDQ